MEITNKYIYNYITIYIWLSWNKHQQKSKFDLCRNGGYSSLWQFNPYSQTNLCIWERWRGTGWTKISEDDDPKVPSWHTTPLQNSLKTPSQPKKRCTPTWFLKFCTHLRHHHSLMVHPIRVAYFFLLAKVSDIIANLSKLPSSWLLTCSYCWLSISLSPIILPHDILMKWLVSYSQISS